MKKKQMGVFLGVTGLLLGGCGMNYQDSATGVGAVAGALVGYGAGGNALSTGIGALVGAMVGGQVGKSMDKTDMMAVSRAFEHGKTGHARRWRNPDTGVQYTMIPKKTYSREYDHKVRPCRKAMITAVIGGVPEKLWVDACRVEDEHGAHWEIVGRS